MAHGRLLASREYKLSMFMIASDEYCNVGERDLPEILKMLHLDWLYCLSLVQTIYTYGLQFLMLLALLAITIFRKEMSCNRCYSEDPIILRPLESISSSEEESFQSWDELGSRELLLEEAGCYGSGTYTLLRQSLQFLYHLIFHTLDTRIWQPLASWWSVASEGPLRLEELLEGATLWSVQPPLVLPPVNAMVKEELIVFPASQSLPNDLMVHIASFLHPKDVVSLASSSRTLLKAIFGDIECNALSKAIWKTLWLRDYGWTVLSWDIGQCALRRSLPFDRIASFDDVVFSHTFYFRFGLCFVDYLVAGLCTSDRCLVGLGGHIYDITNFIDLHPGSPETVMVHSGRDASAIFETMRHTQRARNMAEQFCAVVDGALLGNLGARPTSYLLARSGISSVEGTTSVDPVAPNKCLSRSHPLTLEAIWDVFGEEQELYQYHAARLESKIQQSIVGHVHAFYDPFADKWKAWYMSTSFEAVFVDF